MVQPSNGASDSGASPAEPLLDRTVTHASRLRALALVPLVTALLNIGDLLAVGEADGISIHASFPVYRYDLWSFVDPPRSDGLSVSVPFGTLESLALIVPLLGAYVVVSGALSAGYFGGIADGITTGQFDFVPSVRRFAVRMIALEALVIVALAVVFLPLLVVPPLFVLAILALLVAGYLFFPTVYLIALEDRGIGSAARRAYGLVTRHQPLGFFLAVAVATALCSVPLSLLARAGPFFGVLAAIAAAPLGLAFNVATALKVVEMAGIDAVR
ncbi:hypothetical protein [Halorubrum sp. DTA46]|uniref:hypothetical protein n=1 Tax=Halorubrum sp. DTA46 TaxID=3402162 RepID=UPI003AAB89F7